MASTVWQFTSPWASINLCYFHTPTICSLWKLKYKSNNSNEPTHESLLSIAYVPSATLRQVCSSVIFFCVLRGRIFLISAPFPMEFRWLFSQFWKKNPNLQKIFFFCRLGFSFSQHIHKLHGDIFLQFNDNSMCITLFVFIDQNT